MSLQFYYFYQKPKGRVSLIWLNYLKSEVNLHYNYQFTVELLVLYTNILRKVCMSVAYHDNKKSGWVSFSFLLNCNDHKTEKRQDYYTVNKLLAPINSALNLKTSP